MIVRAVSRFPVDRNTVGASRVRVTLDVQGLRIFKVVCSKYFGQVVIIPATA
jgi:hypothetical protein